MICGVDEAGRGSMLGPLVVAGVAAGRPEIRRLAKIGVKDSKRLSPEARERLCKTITETAKVATSIVGPGTVDRYVRKHRLNYLEARYMARVISKLDPAESYVDSCDVDAARFGRTVSTLSGHAVHSSHGADAKYTVVSAASIVAKVTRDREMAKIRKSHDIGSGYPSDQLTVSFLHDYVRAHGGAPPFARASWAPVRRMLHGAGQTDISSFMR